jgi:hypothetical protein
VENTPNCRTIFGFHFLNTFFSHFQKRSKNQRFVASDSWGMKPAVVRGFEQIVRGAITIAPKVRFLKGKKICTFTEVI